MIILFKLANKSHLLHLFRLWSCWRYLKGLKLIFGLKLISKFTLAYLKGIQDVGIFVSTVFSILIFLGQTVLVCRYMEVYGVHLKKACTEKSKLNMI